MKQFVMTFFMIAVVFASATVASAEAVEQTISSWEMNKNITIGDKVFHWLHASDNLGSAKVRVTNDIIPGLWTLEVHNDGAALVGAGPWTGDLEYTVTITQPGWSFNTVELDSQHVGDSTSVTKNVNYGTNDLTLTSTNGSSDHSSILSWNTQTITVSDHFNVSADSALTSIQNSYTQHVPEPSTFALLGFGGIGLAVRAYRRRAAKVVA